MMKPRRITKRLAAAVAVLAIAAPAAFAATTSSHQTIVHAQLQKSGVVVVTGYDGGAPLLPTR